MSCEPFFRMFLKIFEKIENEKVKYQQLIVFEGFRPHGYQILNQHAILHWIACFKNNIRHLFCKIQKQTQSKTLKTYSSPMPTQFDRKFEFCVRNYVG